MNWILKDQCKVIIPWIRCQNSSILYSCFLFCLFVISFQNVCVGVCVLCTYSNFPSGEFVPWATEGFMLSCMPCCHCSPDLSIWPQCDSVSCNRAVLPSVTSPLFFQWEFGPVEGSDNRAVLPSLTSPLFFQWEFGPVEGSGNRAVLPSVTSPLLFQWEFGPVEGSGNRAVLPSLTSPLFFQGEFGPVEGSGNRAVLYPLLALYSSSGNLLCGRQWQQSCTTIRN